MLIFGSFFRKPNTSHAKSNPQDNLPCEQLVGHHRRAWHIPNQTFNNDNISSVAIPWKSPARRYIGLHACPCGYYGDPLKPCSCSSSTVTRYQKRISGPLLDRIDIHVEVPRVDYEKLSDDRFGEPSAKVQARVESAREIQRQRFGDNGDSRGSRNPQPLSSNSDMHPAEVRKYCQLDNTSQSLMRSAMNQMQLSARAYHRILKLARTIADLAGESEIAAQHLAEALQYRPKITQF